MGDNDIKNQDSTNENAETEQTQVKADDTQTDDGKLSGQASTDQQADSGNDDDIIADPNEDFTLVADGGGTRGGG